MSRREKLMSRMRAAPHDIRFAELETLLDAEGFVLFNSRGSHRAYHRSDGRVITLVQPHGNRKTCNPADVRKLLEVLGL